MDRSSTRASSRKYSLRLMPGLLFRNTTARPFLRRGPPEVKPPAPRCGKIAAEAGQTVAGKCFSCQRKVRAPQSRVLGNAQAPQGDEEGHRDESQHRGESRGAAGETRQPPPGATSNRRTTTWLAESAGRWLEPRGNPGPRGMTVHDRTRLIGQLHFFLAQRAARRTHSVIAARTSGASPSSGVTRNSVFEWRFRIFSTIAGSSRFKCFP